VDAVFGLKTYTHAVRRRERLTGAELEQFERGPIGTNGDSSDLASGTVRRRGQLDPPGSKI